MSAARLVVFSIFVSATAWAREFAAELPAHAAFYFKSPEAEYQRGVIETPASLAKLWTVYLGLNAAINEREAALLSWIESEGQKGVIHSLELRGTGSPEFTPDRAAQTLRDHGVRTILGDITIVDEAYERPLDQREVSDSGYCYNARVNPLNFNRNCVRVRIDAQGARYLDPDMTAPITINYRMGASYNGTRPHFRWLNKERTKFEYVIDVWLKSVESRTSVDVVVPHTGEWMRTKITRFMREAGLRFEPINHNPKGGKLRETMLSDDQWLSSLCTALTESVNVYAESVYNKVAPLAPTDLFARFAEIRLVEGAGLSRANKMPGEAVYRLLGEIAQSAHFGFFNECLPRSGTSGTLKDRLGEVKGRVIAKTGSLTGMSHLAGYYEKDGSWHPFVFMLAAKDLKVSELRALQDRLLVRYLSGAH